MASLLRRVLRSHLRSIAAVALLLSIVVPGQAFGQTPPTPPSSSSSSSRPAPVQIGPVLVSDDFQNPDRGLLPPASVDPDSYEQGYESGYYVIRAVDEEWDGMVELPLPGSYKDTRLSVDVRSIGDRAGFVYLECRRNGNDGYLGAFLMDEGWYGIGRMQNGRISAISPVSVSPYGRLRQNGVTLALTCIGDEITLSLDGIQLARGRDVAFTEGRLELALEAISSDDEPGSLEVRFANLVANQATAAPQPSPTPTVMPTATATPATPAATPATPTVTPAPLSEADVAAIVAPSVVRISAGRGSGSGVKVGEGVITNEHVIRGQQQVQIERSDGTRGSATVVRSDPGFDLALLSTELDLPALQIEASAQQRQGDQVLVMGYPGGLPGQATLSRGLLSAVREIDEVLYVQTDASVTFGSSGGAIVNMRGKLIGVTRGALGTTGSLNFGIAGESVRAFLSGASLVGPDAFEPDDSVQQAKALTIGAPPELRSLHGAGDEDWVSLALAEGMEVAIFTDSPRCDTFLRLYAPDGVTVLDFDDDGGRGTNSWIDFTADETATYFAQVTLFDRAGFCPSYYLAARSLSDASAGVASASPPPQSPSSGSAPRRLSPEWS